MAVSLDIDVVAGDDDAEERADGTGFSSTTTVIRPTASTDAGVRRHGGMRFQNVTVPPGSTINSASVRIYVQSPTNDDMNGIIAAEDVDNAVNFLTDPDVTSRVRTAATTSWAASSLGIGFETSPDIASVVQEVVDRVGWASGNAIVIFIDGATSGTGQCDCQAYEHAGVEMARLSITYTGVAIPMELRNYRLQRAPDFPANL